jgi:hypothetical protein
MALSPRAFQRAHLSKTNPSIGNKPQKTFLTNGINVSPGNGNLSLRAKSQQFFRHIFLPFAAMILSRFPWNNRPIPVVRMWSLKLSYSRTSWKIGALHLTNYETLQTSSAVGEKDLPSEWMAGCRGSCALGRLSGVSIILQVTLGGFKYSEWGKDAAWLPLSG